MSEVCRGSLTACLASVSGCLYSLLCEGEHRQRVYVEVEAVTFYTPKLTPELTISNKEDALDALYMSGMIEAG